MSKKVYVCKECGYVFPEELSHFIESKTQVYCEQCGTPFSSEAIYHKGSKIKTKKKTKQIEKIDKEKGIGLSHTIKVLNYISWIPIFILSIVTAFSRNHHFLAFFGFLIVIYDLAYVSRKIRKDNFDAVVVDSICLGILGCILYGTGVIMLVKGCFIVIYVYLYPKEEYKSVYNFGLKIKNSLNNFSAYGCFLIILLGLHGLSMVGDIYLLSEPPRLIFLSLAVIALIVDLALKNSIHKKQKFYIIDSFGIIFYGILATIFYSAGIFIIIKGAIIFFLSFGEPPEVPEEFSKEIEEKPIYQPPPYEIPQKPIQEDEIKPHDEKPQEILIKEPTKPKTSKTEEKKREEIKKKKERKLEIEDEEEIELRLHESLLPVKDEKDKKLVKQYFLKIFTVLSKDIRKQINELNIPEKDKKELLKELAYLSKKEQIKFIEAIVNLYQEEIPIKLIERIRSIPNVKPEHLAKIAEQLKFMDIDEQEKYIQFLENNA
ncbi:MAG: hypothetical protein ACFFAO_11805 [Candidatus Hermodarchaeota archaeon]